MDLLHEISVSIAMGLLGCYIYSLEQKNKELKQKGEEQGKD